MCTLVLSSIPSASSFVTPPFRVSFATPCRTFLLNGATSSEFLNSNTKHDLTLKKRIQGYSNYNNNGGSGLSKEDTNTEGNSKKKSTQQMKHKKIGARKNISSQELKNIIDTSSPIGVVDPASKIKGTIVSIFRNDDDHDDHDGHDAVGEPCDVMLVQVDRTKNMDKFYVLQLIERTTSKTKPFTVYTRWGRTGNVGTAAEVSYDTLDDALESFEKIFKSKTGIMWDNRDTQPSLKGKYRYIQQNFAMKVDGYNAAKWQYWVDDGVDGKVVDGWYDYTSDGSVQTEQLFMEHSANPDFSFRVVQSGRWSYGVDLVKMTQTNITHPNRTSRHIRRVQK
jgi:predicted DNA-binding WGR domain protein